MGFNDEKNSMKIIIADDHALVREGIAHILGDCVGIDEIIQVSSLVKLRTALGRHPDTGLILLDISMSEDATPETLPNIRERVPGVLIAMLSVHENSELANTYFQYGASGYIPKSVSNEVLVKAVQLIMGGSIYIPAFVLKKDQSHKHTFERSNTSLQLTRRQLQVLRLIADGLTNKDIAEELDLSLSTVKTHSSSVLKAFGVSNRLKATNKAIEMGLIEKSV